MLGAVNVRLITRNTSYMQPFFFKAQHRARNYIQYSTQSYNLKNSSCGQKAYRFDDHSTRLKIF